MLCGWEFDILRSGESNSSRDNYITCRLTACRLGSALDPVLVTEYGTTLYYYYVVWMQVDMQPDLLCSGTEHWSPARWHLRQCVCVRCAGDSGVHCLCVDDELQAVGSSLDWCRGTRRLRSFLLHLHPNDTVRSVQKRWKALRGYRCQSYGASPAIFDHTVLPATLTQLNEPHHNSNQTGWYSIWLPRRDGRLSWPWWLLHVPRWFNIRRPFS